MKMSLISLFLFSFCISIGTAQITITNTDMPSVNDIKVVSIGNPADVISPELTGVNYLWDFSNLTSQQQRIDTFLSVTSTPFTYQFFFNNIFIYPDNKADFGVPVATPALIPQISLTDVINYYSNQGGVYKQVGFGANINGIPASVQYTPTDTIYDFTVSYGNTHTNSAYFDLAVPGFGFYGQTSTHIDTVDGWGTVMTPFGTYNALRIKSTIYRTDTVYVDAISLGTSTPRPVEIQYKWLANNEDVPVLIISETLGAVSSVEYQDSLLNLNVVDLKPLQVKIYPNPATSFCQIESNTPIGKISVIDANGKIVKQLKGNSILHNLSITDLSAGLYMVKVETIFGHVLERLVVMQ